MTKYLITRFDYNDVYDRQELDFDTYEDAEKYVYSQINPNYIKEFSWLGTDPDALVHYMPVTDENGNEIDENDPRYQELNDQQESLIDMGIEIMELEE